MQQTSLVNAQFYLLFFFFNSEQRINERTNENKKQFAVFNAFAHFVSFILFVCFFFSVIQSSNCFSLPYAFAIRFLCLWTKKNVRSEFVFEKYFRDSISLLLPIRFQIENVILFLSLPLSLSLLPLVYSVSFFFIVVVCVFRHFVYACIVYWLMKSNRDDDEVFLCSPISFSCSAWVVLVFLFPLRFFYSFHNFCWFVFFFVLQSQLLPQLHIDTKRTKWKKKTIFFTHIYICKRAT